MASPQKENGYTPIANEIMEAITSCIISPANYSIIFMVLRQTYGWSKKEDFLSLSQLSRMTGLPAREVSRAKASLFNKKVLIKTKKGLTFNKNYEEWLVERRIPLSKLPLSKKTVPPLSKKTDTTTTLQNNKLKIAKAMSYHELNDGEVTYEEEEVKPKKQGHRGKAIGSVATYYFTLLGKKPYLSKPLADVIGQMLDLAKEAGCKDEQASIKEIKGRIDIAKWHYQHIKIKDFGLGKVLENWDIILKEWYPEKKKSNIEE